MAANIGGQRLQIITPPVQSHQVGWHRIVTDFSIEIAVAEGCVLSQPGDVVVSTSRDCPHVIVCNENNGLIGIAHVGRESMRPRCSRSTIHELMRAIGVRNGKDLTAFICGGISGPYFTHKDIGPLIEFANLYGEEVLNRETGALDLAKIIRNCLHLYGVPEKQISTDGYCTYKNDWLGSKRAGKDGSNWTIVIKH